MRLGAGLVTAPPNPEDWAAAHRDRGYTTAIWPLREHADVQIVQEYAAAAAAAEITFAEVGVWNNPLSRDKHVRQAAIQRCQERLTLAEEIGARCCVNVAGSRGEQWDGPDADNFSADTFNLIVETVRTIIDAVRPSRTAYTLEPMPWMYPDSADSYLDLIRAIDRPQFAAHLDPVNVITGPRAFFANGALLREWFTKLGPYIKSSHAKDIRLTGKLTVHLEEVRPGLGALDYHTYLRELSRLDRDMPLIVEHLGTDEDYRLAVDHVHSVARAAGVSFV